MTDTYDSRIIILGEHAERRGYIAAFGYELKNINKSYENSAKDLATKAIGWHNRFFNAISNLPTDCRVECKYRKNEEEDANGEALLRIAILFYLHGKGINQLKKEAAVLIRELVIFFELPEANPLDSYYFTPIASKMHFDEFHYTPAELKTSDYLRKPVWFSENDSGIGYKTKEHTPEKLCFVPQFFIPDFFSLGHIAQRISQSGSFLELSLWLSPIKLGLESLNIYKAFLKKNRLQEDFFTPIEKDTYTNHLQTLFDDNTNHFLFHVRLRTSEENMLGHSFHNTIADGFFGNILNVEVSETSSQSIEESFAEKECMQILPFLYSQELVMHCFRLPVAGNDNIHWFPHETGIFNYFPRELPENGVLIGVKKSAHHKQEIRINHNDLARHVYIIGQTGVGKTTMIKTMILDQINAGEGVCVVDPHGDLVEAINLNIPSHRVFDVKYIDPTRDKYIKINILEYSDDYPEQKTFIFNELIKLLDELYDLRSTGGPMFEQYFKNALLLVMERKETLNHFYQFFHNDEFREEVLQTSKLSFPVSFFRQAARIKGEASFEFIAPYITSKINRFVQDDFIGPIISEKRSNINFREIMDNKKILLIRLPKGRLGSDGVKFIGTLLFNRIVMAGFTREDIPYNKREPYFLYIDEFQNFTNEDIETALSESRKFGLRLIMANQNLSQLSEKMIKIMLGNVGNTIFFRPGPFDIESLRPYFKYDITDRELLNMPNFKAVARIMNKNIPLKPFILETIM